MFGNSGAAMLLKSFGLDMAEVEKKLQGEAQKVQQVLEYFKSRFDAIEENQKRILAFYEGSSDGRQPAAITAGGPDQAGGPGAAGDATSAGGGGA